MTNSNAASAKPVPTPPAKPKPVASREELLELLSAGHGNFTVTVK